MLTFGSLFAGIGGFDLGFERAGMKCVWQVEIDEYCQKVLAKHWPEVKRYGDIRETGKHNLEPVDLICGGFPCQPHSVAGKRRGAEDDRDLWPEYRRIISEIRPRWVVAENVPGIRTTILDQVLSDLEGIDYSVETIIIPACAFDAPHRRERIFIVAHTHENSKSNQPIDEQREVTRSMDVAHASGMEREARTKEQRELREMRGNGRECNNTDGSSKTYATTSHTAGEGFQDGQPGQVDGCAQGAEVEQPERSSWWSVEPGMGRVANGVPGRVDRLKSLGNAVVPQVAEWLGRRIIEADYEH
jgi:DNA (cytosine-5)-methyltransferase 1